MQMRSARKAENLQKVGDVYEIFEKEQKIKLSAANRRNCQCIQLKKTSVEELSSHFLSNVIDAIQCTGFIEILLYLQRSM